MPGTALDYPFAESPAHGTTTEVAPGIRWLQMPMGGSLDHINLYLLEEDAGWTVVDTGLATETVRELWHRLFEEALDGKPVLRVLCTHMHPDHIGQAGMITDHYRCPLLMSQAEYFHARAFAGPSSMSSWQSEAFYVAHGMPAEVLEALRQRWTQRRERTTEDDGYSMPALPPGYRRLRHGDTLSIGGRDWRVLVGSGHSPEHVCLYCNASGILLSGDQGVAGDHLECERASDGGRSEPAQGVARLPRSIPRVARRNARSARTQCAVPRPAPAAKGADRAPRGSTPAAGGAVRGRPPRRRPPAGAVPAPPGSVPDHDGARGVHRPPASAAAPEPHCPGRRR